MVSPLVLELELAETDTMKAAGTPAAEAGTVAERPEVGIVAEEEAAVVEVVEAGPGPISVK